jgi:hypothetical protein
MNSKNNKSKTDPKTQIPIKIRRKTETVGVWST